MTCPGPRIDGMTTAEWMRWQVARTRAEIHPELPGEIRSDLQFQVCWSGCPTPVTWAVAKSRDGRKRRFMCDRCAARFPIAPGTMVVDRTIPPKIRRPMTDDEKTMARALGRVTMIPGIPSKALARDLSAIADVDKSPKITERQAAALRSLVVRYRRQIPREVVALAGDVGRAAVGDDT